MKYLRIYWIDLHQIYRIGRHMGGDDKSYITFAVAQGTLLWYPINFGAKFEHKLIPPLFFALAFSNVLEYLNARINSGDDLATSYNKRA